MRRIVLNNTAWTPPPFRSPAELRADLEAMPAPATYKAAMRAVIDGRDGAEVVDMLRTTADGRPRKSQAAVKTAVSDVRTLCLRLGMLHGDYAETVRALIDAVESDGKAECRDMLRRFLRMDVSGQYRHARQYAARRGAGYQVYTNCGFNVPLGIL